MSEEQIENIELKKAEQPTVFEAHCMHCKEKTVLTLDNGKKIYLPYALVQIPKDKEMIKEFKQLIKENESKYKNIRALKRRIIHGCPICKHDIDIPCKDYVDFYAPKKKKTEENS